MPMICLSDILLCLLFFFLLHSTVESCFYPAHRLFASTGSAIRRPCNCTFVSGAWRNSSRDTRQRPIVLGSDVQPQHRQLPTRESDVRGGRLGFRGRDICSRDLAPNADRRFRCLRGPPSLAGLSTVAVQRTARTVHALPAEFKQSLRTRHRCLTSQSFPSSYAAMTLQSERTGYQRNCGNAKEQSKAT